MPNLFLHFFATIDELHLVTLQLELYHDKLSCPHCQAFGQFVSHGFVYKYLSASEVSVVGKRLFCSNRSNHSGCGKTIRLYVSKRVPKISYHAANVTLFVMSLIAGMSIKNAYHKATGASEPRHGIAGSINSIFNAYVFAVLFINRLLLHHLPFNAALGVCYCCFLHCIYCFLCLIFQIVVRYKSPPKSFSSSRLTSLTPNFTVFILNIFTF
jgi:hypothetical protein